MTFNKLKLLLILTLLSLNFVYSAQRNITLDDCVAQFLKKSEMMSFVLKKAKATRWQNLFTLRSKKLEKFDDAIFRKKYSKFMENNTNFTQLEAVEERLAYIASLLDKKLFENTQFVAKFNELSYKDRKELIEVVDKFKPSRDNAKKIQEYASKILLLINKKDTRFIDKFLLKSSAFEKQAINQYLGEEILKYGLLKSFEKILGRKVSSNDLKSKVLDLFLNKKLLNLLSKPQSLTKFKVNIPEELIKKCFTSGLSSCRKDIVEVFGKQKFKIFFNEFKSWWVTLSVPIFLTWSYLSSSVDVSSIDNPEMNNYIEEIDDHLSDPTQLESELELSAFDEALVRFKTSFKSCPDDEELTELIESIWGLKRYPIEKIKVILKEHCPGLEFFN